MLGPGLAKAGAMRARLASIRGLAVSAALTGLVGLLSLFGGGTALAAAPAARPPSVPAPSAPDAQSEPPKSSASPVSPGVSAGLLVGYGFSGDAGYYLGFGARAGYTLPINVYLGATFIYHLGMSMPVEYGGTVKAQAYYFGGEVGYAIAAGPVAVCPYVGVGRYTLKNSESEGVLNGVVVFPATSSTSNHLALWPGVTATYPMGSAFVGVDVRFNVATGIEGMGNANSLSAFLTGGIRF
jgi:hypothetical protein